MVVRQSLPFSPFDAPRDRGLSPTITIAIALSLAAHLAAGAYVALQRFAAPEAAPLIEDEPFRGSVVTLTPPQAQTPPPPMESRKAVSPRAPDRIFGDPVPTPLPRRRPRIRPVRRPWGARPRRRRRLRPRS